MKKLKYVLSLVFFIISIVITLLIICSISFIFKFQYLKNQELQLSELCQKIENILELNGDSLSESALDNESVSILILDKDKNIKFSKQYNSNKLEYLTLPLEKLTNANYQYTSHTENFNNILYFKKFTSTTNKEYYILLELYMPISKVFSTTLSSTFVLVLILVTVVLLIISYVISVFVVSPIEELTAKSKKIYQSSQEPLTFNIKGYYETEELSSTLTYASKEIYNVEKFRKQLVANVSHDFRTPLTMIISNIELIQELYMDNPEKLNEKLNIILNESNRLKLLVEDLLDLSKIQNNLIEFHYETIDLNVLIQNIINNYSSIEAQGYEIIFSPISTPIKINVDKNRMEQVIYNIINNAINYTGKSKLVYVMTFCQDNNFILEITDEGKGIKESEKDKIFEMYYRGKKTSRETIGTGLGLSIVKNILIQHNLNFGIESIENVGTTFWIKFPINQ